MKSFFLFFARRRRLKLAWVGVVFLSVAVFLHSQEVVAKKYDSRLGPPFSERQRLHLGNPDARVLLIVVTNPLCGTCIRFHEQVLKPVREKYISRGTVRLCVIPIPDPKKDPRGSIARATLACGSSGEPLRGLDQAMKLAVESGHIDFSQLAHSCGISPEKLHELTEDPSAQQAYSMELNDVHALRAQATPVLLFRVFDKQGRFEEARYAGYHPLDFVSEVLESALARP